MRSRSNRCARPPSTCSSTRKSAAISLSNGATFVGEKGGPESKKPRAGGSTRGENTRFRIRIGAQYRNSVELLLFLRRTRHIRASYNASPVRDNTSRGRDVN